MPFRARKYVIVTTEFTPGLKVGGQFEVKSSITAANGSWTTFKLDYFLESMMPRGKWFAILAGAPIRDASDVSGSQFGGG
jgi:hypothetical protein